MLDDIKKIEADLEIDIKNSDDVSLKEKYFGKDGLVTLAFKNIPNIAKDQRAEYGRVVNNIKQRVDEYLNNISKNDKDIYSSTSEIDPTAPFDINCKDSSLPTSNCKGSIHPITQEVAILVDIFKSMGFDVLESRQLDDDFHMFESLNFPKGHPARDMYDTFVTEDNFVLPAHTSTMQNRALKKFGPPPIAVVLPGRCFRNEATDASHEHTFHQMEGIYVDKKISIGNMQATIKTFLERYLNTELEIKVQPAYFPFTEPDCEFVIRCPFCNKVGCKTCGYSTWIELMGCGMIHPNVLKEGGIDPEVYSGFAWGFGVDRLTMIKLGITDIREIRDSNLNFLRQF